MGEWVDPTRQSPRSETKAPEFKESSYGSWIVSSFDLLRGAEVSHDPDTVPPELFDELFPPSATSSDKGRA